ncbi:MAG: hypothetical protein RPT11_06970 [Bermanella sp.]
MSVAEANPHINSSEITRLLLRISATRKSFRMKEFQLSLVLGQLYIAFLRGILDGILTKGGCIGIEMNKQAGA